MSHELHLWQLQVFLQGLRKLVHPYFGKLTAAAVDEVPTRMMRPRREGGQWLNTTQPTPRPRKASDVEKFFASARVHPKTATQTNPPLAEIVPKGLECGVVLEVCGVRLQLVVEQKINLHRQPGVVRLHRMVGLCCHDARW